MIKYGILVGGLVFYFFAISTLIRDIRDQNFNKSFLRLIDNDEDGIITSKEVKDFAPCPDYDKKRVSRAFSEYGRRADLNDLAQDLTPKVILSSVQKCVGDVDGLSHDQNIKNTPKAEITTKMLDAFDIDNDKQIRWSEYHISNQFLKKTPKNLRQIFRYFDKNHDWRISQKELKSSKPQFIHTFLTSGKRK